MRTKRFYCRGKDLKMLEGEEDSMLVCSSLIIYATFQLPLTTRLISLLLSTLVNLISYLFFYPRWIRSFDLFSTRDLRRIKKNNKICY